MRLLSQNSQFIFNLPSDFITQEVSERHRPILEKNYIQYENVIDYVNSTIKSIDFPSISIPTVQQNLIRGKVRQYKPAINSNDIVNRTLNVNFASVDAHLNYFILHNIVFNHYLDTNNLYLKPFMVTALDIKRDGIYNIIFKEVILTNMSDLRFDYSQQKVSSPEFTLSFSFNFYNIDFLLDNSKVLELNEVPQIIQKI
jgi:hypothetical protein